jgi:hypothetical protein
MSCACRKRVQLIPNAARYAHVRGNSEARHISAAKSKAFVNEWNVQQKRFAPALALAIAIQALQAYIRRVRDCACPYSFGLNGLFLGTRKIRI